MGLSIRASAIFIIFAGIVALSPCHSYSADKDADSWWGIEFGVNYSRFDYSDVPQYWDPEWASGFHAGFFVLFPMKSRLLLNPSIRFLRMNNEVEILEANTPEENSLGGRFEIVQDYIALAALIKTDNIIGKHFFFVFGPELGFLIRADHTRKSVHTVPSDPDRAFILTENYSYYDSMEKLNIALDVGLGIEFDVGGHLGYWQVTYVHGFTGNAKELPESDPGVSFDWKSREVRVAFGISF
jgi:hypothetical protein